MPENMPPIQISIEDLTTGYEQQTGALVGRLVGQIAALNAQVTALQRMLAAARQENANLTAALDAMENAQLDVEDDSL